MDSAECWLEDVYFGVIEMQTLAIVFGLGFILFILVEAFEALVLPRRVLRPFRFTRFYYQVSWRTWTSTARLFRAEPVRQSFLSVFGPLSLLVLFSVWAVGLIIGFGFVQYGLAPVGWNIGAAIYLSGTTFTTLGYGDFTPATPLARVFS